jgi:hypothetical protein
MDLLVSSSIIFSSLAAGHTELIMRSAARIIMVAAISSRLLGA